MLSISVNVVLPKHASNRITMLRISVNVVLPKPVSNRITMLRISVNIVLPKHVSTYHYRLISSSQADSMYRHIPHLLVHQYRNVPDDILRRQEVCIQNVKKKNSRTVESSRPNCYEL